MKIVQWNISKASQPMYALKKYEDELYDNISNNGKYIIERVRRSDGRILGSTVFSWPIYNRKGADIVHATSQTLAPSVYFTKSRRFIVTVHDLAPMVYPSEITDYSLRIQYMLTPHALKKADKIISISHFTKKELVRLTGIDEEDICVVHQGVDHRNYKPLNKIKSKEKFGLNPDDKHILVVSSSLEHKRMDLAKKVFNYMRNQRNDVKMIKAGYGEALVGDDIISAGWVPEDDMPFLFNASDVYLHTSDYEGFGLPILESMACGVPVVANNKASVPEIVGGCGTLIDFNIEDVGRISSKISSLIDSGLDLEAIERSNNFSWKRTAEETLKVYETM